MANPEIKNYSHSPIRLEEDLLELKDGIEWDEKTKKKEKQEIKKQYPYRTDEDVDARYEIEHMKYRSADIMEDLHKGINPSEALKNYKAELEKITNGTTSYHKEEKGIDGYTCTKKYDEYGRIILQIRKFDTAKNWEFVSTYTYNSDGSYITVSTLNGGDRLEEHYDTHGKHISSHKDWVSVDFSKEKFIGDYIFDPSK